MTEPAKENARFAEQLIAAGEALKSPPGANGDGLSADQRRELVTMGFLYDMVEFIGATIGKQVKALSTRIAGVEKMRSDEIEDVTRPQLTEIERRLATLEASLAECLKDAGTWKPSRSFTTNQLVTYRGVLWRCLRPNSVRPGTTDGDWRMLLKSQGHRWNGSTTEM